MMMMMMMKVILQIVRRGDAVVQITTGAPLLERPFKTDTVLSISKELSDELFQNNGCKRETLSLRKKNILVGLIGQWPPRCAIELSVCMQILAKFKDHFRRRCISNRQTANLIYPVTVGR